MIIVQMQKRFTLELHSFQILEQQRTGKRTQNVKLDGSTYNDIWYTFTAGASGTLIVSTCGLVDYDSDLVVYEGDDCGSLTLLACNDDGSGCANFSSYIETPVYIGDRLTIRVGSYLNQGGGSGTLLLDIVDSGGSPVPSPANDDCADAVVISEGNTYFTTSEATTDGPAHPKCEVANDGGVTGNDIWYTYTPSANGLLSISTCDQTNYDTDLVIYDNSNCSALSFLACNDDGPGCGAYSSYLEVAVVGGVEHLIRVGGFEEGSSGTGILTVSLDTSTTTWVGPDQGSWFDANNWSTGAIPNAKSDVSINGSVSIDQPNATASSVTIQSNGHLQVGIGTATLGSLSANIVVESGGILQLQNTISSITSTSIVIDAGGQLNWFGGTMDISGGILDAATNILVGCFDDAVLIADYGAIYATNFTLCDEGSMYGSSWTYVDTFTNHGTVYAGGATNYTKIYGNYAQSSSGTLVTYYTSDTLHTWLIVTNGTNTTGTSTIEGTVQLVSIGGYTPDEGTSFEVLKSYQSLHSGTFDTIEIIDFAGSISFYQSEDVDGLSVVTQVTPIHYVDADSVSGNGTSWATAFPTVQEALAVANFGEQIWIAEGTYKPGSARTDTFALGNFVSLYGGFDGTETSINQRDIAAHPTILSGDIGVPDSNVDNVYHVVTKPSESISFLDGLTITGGHADGGGLYQSSGAGIFQGNTGALALSNCTIIDNNADEYGGGLYTKNNFTTFINCRIENNKSVHGGGIYALDSLVSIDQSLVVGNRANTFEVVFGVYGGGLHIDGGMLNVTDSEFQGNSAAYGVGLISQGSGGAIYAKECDTTISRTSFEENRAISGGAIFFNDISYSQIALINHCSFERNYIYYNMNWTGTGAAAFQQNGTSCVTNVVNCLFAGNDGEGESIIDMGITGGYLNRITNCTIAHNVDLDTSPAIAGSAKVENCILWHNEGTYGRSFYQQINGPFLIDTCLIDGFETMGAISGEDPLFVSPRGPDGVYRTGDEDYHLVPGSPIIDWGDDGLWNYPIASVPQVDLDGNPRFINDPYSYDWDPPSTIDLGCYEFQTQYSGVPGFRSWNYEGEGKVNFETDSLWNPNEAPTSNDDVIINTRCAHFSYVLVNQDTTINKFFMPQGYLYYFLNNNTITITDTDDAFILGHHDVTDFAFLALLNGTVVANKIDVGGSVSTNAYFGINSAMTLQVADGLVIRNNAYLYGGGTVQGNVYNSGTIQRDSMHNNYPIIDGDYSMVDASIAGLEGSGTFDNDLEPIDYIPENGYDKLEISGTAMLGGTLTLSGASDTPVVAGQTITLLNAAGGITGTFDSIWAWNFDEDILPVVSYVNNVHGSGQSVVVTMQSVSGLLGFGDPDATGIAGLPRDAELADLNGDGYPELILSSPSDIPDATGNIFILYNNGNDGMDIWQGFSDTIQQIPVGVGPAGIAVGDMDDDGDLDIAVANTEDDTIDILINQSITMGSVSFETLDPPLAADYYDPTAEVLPTDVALGNFSDDNILDIAICQ